MEQPPPPDPVQTMPQSPPPAVGDDAPLDQTGRIAASIRQIIRTNEPDSHHVIHACAMANACAVLWSRYLRFDPACPTWFDRDRFVVSSVRYRTLVDALVTLSGQAAIRMDDTPHPATAMGFGPSGQGLGAAIGMAMAEQHMAARFGRTLVNHRIWAVSCWSELSTGVALEAAVLAGQMGLDRITVLVGLSEHERVQAEAALPRYAASGWSVRKVAADQPEQIAAAIASSIRTHRPCLIACLSPAPDAETAEPFVDDPGLWASAARRGATARRSWLRRLTKDRQRIDFERLISGERPALWRTDWRRSWQGTGRHRVSHPALPTTSYARRGLDILRELLPEVLCLRSRLGLASGATTGHGPAALPTRCDTQVHGMAALLNGIALHGGFLPCGAATFVAVDRMRPALRFAAMMKRQVIYFLTDGGLSPEEDGPAWLPVEQLASLRAMPNVAVFRPATRRETMECMELALERTNGPSLLTLCPFIPASDMAADASMPNAHPLTNLCARGGYVVADSPTLPRQVTLIATGQEVATARAAQLLLCEQGIGAALVSLPCWELFAAQKISYREQVLGTAPRIGVEAASGFGWERWLGQEGTFIGIDGFGENVTAGTRQVRNVTIEPEHIVARALEVLHAHGNGPAGTIGNRRHDDGDLPFPDTSSRSAALQN